MSRKRRGAKGTSQKHSAANPSAAVAAARSGESDTEITATQLAEGMERRFTESTVPQATDYSDRQLWRKTMYHFRDNQLEAAAVLREVRATLSQEAAAKDESEEEYHAAVIRAVDAAIRDKDQRRAAEIRDSDGRRAAEVRTLHSRTDHEEARKDALLEQKIKEWESRRKIESGREALLMTMTGIAFLATVVFGAVGIDTGQAAPLGVSGLSALFTATGAHRLFRRASEPLPPR